MKLKELILLGIIGVLFIKCANQLPPGGGEIDRIPPEILESNPENKTTNYYKKSVEFYFSEYVDKRGTKDAVFISPAIEGKVEFDWSGTNLEIIFEDSLKQNTTYTITVGTDIKDVNNGNNLASPYILTFSTGNKIDVGEVTGNLYDSKPLGVYIFAYLEGDSVYNPTEVKPDFISQVGAEGEYKVQGLKPGNYKIFAVRDISKDFVYDIGLDEYASPFTEVVLTGEDTLFGKLNYQLTSEDTTKPGIINVTMTDRHHLLFEFTEYIDSTKLTRDNFYIYDSTENKRFEMSQLFKGVANSKQLFLTIKDSLSEDNDIYIYGLNIPDNFGNLSGIEEYALTVNSLPDTTAPGLKKLETLFPNNKIDYEAPEIRVLFDDGIIMDSLDKAIKIEDPKQNIIPFVIRRFDDSIFDIEVSKKLKEKSNYTLFIDFGMIKDLAGNSQDSLHTIPITTSNDLMYSGAEGRVTADSGNYIVVLEELMKKKNVYQKKLDSENKFKFEKIIPGKYLIWFYDDKDSSGTFDYGSIFPFRESERFEFFTDTLNLRARWPVGDIQLRY